MRRYSDPDTDEEHLTYGRPSLPSWIAAAAVAFAFFLLGGFIKTYQQLEALKVESRREISELREAMRRLQAQSQTAVRQPMSRLVPLPPAERRDSRGYYDYTRQAYQDAPVSRPPLPTPASSPPSVAGAAGPSGAGTGGPAVRPRDFAAVRPDLLGATDDERDRPRYQIGRRSPDDGSGILTTLAGGSCQVVSVSTTHNRIMVEGGRDIGLAEGARLELVRNGRWIADLRILDVFDNQSACEVLHATQQPQPGDIVRRPPQSQ
ncbi:MAG: hypothetical protein LUG50_12085 [Planctomycetaceae bacterium]|nr:hypothetical protein [Planctomycetaceae bacterium]